MTKSGKRSDKSATPAKGKQQPTPEQENLVSQPIANAEPKGPVIDIAGALQELPPHNLTTTTPEIVKTEDG